MGCSLSSSWSPDQRRFMHCLLWQQSTLFLIVINVWQLWWSSYTRNDQRQSRMASSCIMLTWGSVWIPLFSIIFKKKRINFICHPIYSADHVSSDYWLFGTFKRSVIIYPDASLQGRAITKALHSIPIEDYWKSLQKWIERMELCIQNRWDYFEQLVIKYRKNSLVSNIRCLSAKTNILTYVA
jgi:hypothetical protein